MVLPRLIEVPEFSAGGDNPLWRKTRYKMVGFTDEAIARSLVRTSVPFELASSAGTLYRNNIETRQTAYNHVEVDVTYGAQPTEVGKFTWGFSTMGATVHITHSRETIASYPLATYTTGAPYKGTIGVTHDNRDVQGCEIVIPVAKLWCRYTHPQGTVTLDHFDSLAAITGRVNSTLLFGRYQPGEALFLGAEGEDGTNTDATLIYHFGISKNETGLSFGAITNVAKKGWEYIWVKYTRSTFNTGIKDMPVRLPELVSVERVYPEANLQSTIGI